MLAKLTSSVLLVAVLSVQSAGAWAKSSGGEPPRWRQQLHATRVRVGQAIGRLIYAHPRATVATTASALVTAGIWSVLGGHAPEAGSGMLVGGTAMLLSQLPGAATNVYVRHGRLGIRPVQEPREYLKETLFWSTMSGALFALSSYGAAARDTLVGALAQGLGTLGAFAAAGRSMWQGAVLDGVGRR